MPTLHWIFGYLRLLFIWLFNNFRGIQKKRDCTLVSSTIRGCRIALYIRTDNAKPTPNIKYTLVLHS